MLKYILLISISFFSAFNTQSKNTPLHCCIEYGDSLNGDFLATTFNNKTYHNLNDAIKNFKSVKEILLYNYNVIPEELACFIYLEDLEIAYCSGEKSLKKILRKFKDLKSLKNLTLFRNSFINYPDEFDHIENLETIYIDGDSITNIPLSIGKLTKLKAFALSDCINIDLKQVFDVLRNNRSLIEFEYSASNIDRLPDNIQQLNQIEWLVLYGNKFNKIPTNIKTMSNIKRLGLFDNEIETLGIDKTSLINLEYLDLNFNPITNIPEELTYFKNLKTLEILTHKNLKINVFNQSLHTLLDINLIDNNTLNNKDIAILNKNFPNAVINFK